MHVTNWVYACVVFCIFYHPGLSSDVVGVLGGNDNASRSGYVALVSSSGIATPLQLPSMGAGTIASVATNGSEYALVGGSSGFSTGYAAFVFSDGSVNLLTPINTTEINSVAINSVGLGLIGGTNYTNAYVAFVSPPSSILNTFNSLPSNDILSVAIDNSGNGLIGGTSGSSAYAAFINSSGIIKEFTTLPAATIFSVAINGSEQGLIGGNNNTTAYAAFVNFAGTIQTFSSLPATSINAVAINSTGIGLIGGTNNYTNSYAAFINSAGIIKEFTTLPPVTIVSVSINDAGQGLVGGYYAGSGYAAFVDSSGIIQSLALAGSNIIDTVAINSAGNGLVGGRSSTAGAYAALVYPSGSTISIAPLPLTGIGEPSVINGANFLSLLSPLLAHIPTAGLTGNNLTLANYINTYSPNTSLYFLPSVLNDTLSQALESAAPTRHAFDLFIADNNLFFLNNSLTQHAEDMRLYWFTQAQYCDQIKNRAPQKTRRPPESNCPCDLKNKPYQFWLEIIGASSSEKAQHQTPSFQPWSTGAVFGFDTHLSQASTYGVGAAYTYTYNHEKQHAGHSRIQQEYLFVYGLWNREHFYGNAAIWGGAFQIHNTREIEMTSFQFESTSRPRGWQLAPHVEIGYRNYYKIMTFEPFAMFDWANNWQNQYRETGSGPLNFGQKAHYCSFLRSEFGVRLCETVEFNSWRLVLQEKGSYVNKEPFRLGDVTAYLVSSSGFVALETLTTPQNLGVASFKILLTPKTPCYPYGSLCYQGEFGSTYQSHQLSANMGWNF